MGNSMIKFEDGRYYVMSGAGLKFSDYDGPFDDADQSLDYIRNFINKNFNFSPEMLRMVVVQYKEYQEGGQLEIVKQSGVILNGEYVAGQLEKI